MTEIESNRMHSMPGSSTCVHCVHATGVHQQAAMWKIVFRLLLAMTIAPWLDAIPAQAQATRTYVSGLGKDSNPCAAAAPCQTLQAALTQTLAGGQIYALDS